MRDKTMRGHRLAVRVASSILGQQSAILQNIMAVDRQEALQAFRDYSDHLFSFVDCASFAVMERFSAVAYCFRPERDAFASTLTTLRGGSRRIKPSSQATLCSVKSTWTAS